MCRVSACTPNRAQISLISCKNEYLGTDGYVGLQMTKRIAPSKDRSLGTMPLHFWLAPHAQCGRALCRRALGGGRASVVGRVVCSYLPARTEFQWQHHVRRNS